MSKILKVVATVAAIYFTAGAAAFVAASAGAVGAVATIASVANYLAVGAVLSGIARALQPKPRIAGNPGVLTEYAGTTEPARIVYGRIRVSGLNTIPPLTTGSDNQDLHQVLTIAGHEIDGFDEYWANQEQVTPAAVTGTSGDGLVSTGTYANRMWVRGYRGTTTQTADFILDQASGSWTADHRGRGIAYAAITYRYNETAYRSGKPDMSFVVRGKRCYDPRMDTSPGANPTNAAYVAYTNNPALISADYLIDQEIGRRVSPTRVNWADVVTAANICDETLSAGNQPPSGSQKRYTCNVVLNVAQTIEDHEENQSILAAAMLGVVYRSGGQWRMYAGAWSTPAFTLGPDDVIGSVQVATAIRRRDTWNTVNGTFLDASRNYVQQEFPEVTSAAFVTADGRKLPKPISLPACTDVYEAQRAAIILLRQSRNRRTVTVECGLTHYRVRIWQTGTVTLPEIGWTNQTVRCTGWRLSPEGRVELTLQEAYAADWANPATADYVVPGTTGTPTIGFTRPGTPASFAATSQAAAIRFTIGASDPYILGQTFRIYEAASGGSFASATRVWEGVSSDAIVYKSDTTSRDYWVTAHFDGQESAARPVGAGLAAAAGSAGAGPAGADGRSVALVYIYQRAASPPTLPSVSTTFTFATGVLTGLNNGWTQTIPSGTGQLYVASATASATTATDTIASGEWSTPVVLAQNGLDGGAGANGLNAATVYLFQRTTGATPSLPSSNVTYTFATGVATGITNGWSQTLPTSGGAFRWVTTATALSASTTDTIVPGEWAAAALLAQDGTNGSNGSNGSDGAPGTSTAVVFLFQRTNTATPPSVPSNTTTFTFATGALAGINNGWSQTLPTSGGPYRWVTTATASGTGSTDTIGSGEWATPSILSEDGGITAPPTFSVGITGPGTSFSFSNGTFSLGTYTASPTNGTSPFTYEWFFPEQLNTYGPSVTLGSITGSTNALSSSGFNNLYETTIGVRAIDTTGRVAIGFTTIFVQHGTPP